MQELTISEIEEVDGGYALLVIALVALFNYLGGQWGHDRVE
jgi:hypothetical protein